MRKAHLVGLVSLVSIGSLALTEREARACGGCFVPTEVESVITDEKMILAVSMNQTTLYDQINYSGNPASFAWVLPIKGQVTVGLSADVLFQVINQQTQTTVQQPPTNCPPPPSCGYGGATFAAGAAAPGECAGSQCGSPNNNGGGVVVTSQQQVGPYETVQLHSTDGSALTNWLTAHGYNIPDSTKPIIDAYVTQQFDFLALKLVPGQGVQSMQPVRVTSQGAAPSLPLHMVAIGTGPTTGITIWVVADGRWQPSNFPTFMIADSEIAWDWATSSSNYETLRLSKEATYGGRGWQIESSLELSQYSLEQSLGYAAEYDATGGYLVGAAAGAADAGADAATSQGDAGVDAAGIFGMEPDVQELAAVEDLGVMFAGIAGPNVRITRMRSDVAQSALSVDMSLQASADQTELTNVHTPQQEIGEPICPIYSATTCEQVGTAPRSQAQAQAAAQASSVGGGGCATTPTNDRTGTTLATLFSVCGLAAFRIARKRRKR